MDYKCPIHTELELELCEYENDEDDTVWEYARCPDSDCFVACGLERLEAYLLTMKDPSKFLDLYRKGLICRCGDPTRLCISGSIKNPDRLYFKCRWRSCKFFRWADKNPPIIKSIQKN